MSMEIMKQAFDALREMHYALGRAHATMRRPTKYVKAALLQGQSAITALRPVIEQAEDAVAAEREAILEAVEALTGMEADRHKMFSEGYDHALYHIRQVVEGRSKV